MGFLDKVKSAAQDVAQEAKKATATAQSKMEQSQIRKKMNEAAEKLGYLVYRERSQGTSAGAEADQLVSEITSLEAQLEQEEAAPEAAPEAPAAQPEGSVPGAEGGGPTAPGGAVAPPPSTSASEPASGDFKL